MPLWRHFPPVHGALPHGALSAALAARSATGAAAARERAAARLAALYPGREIRLLDSGTSALTLALRATRRRGEQPQVALPAYACPDVGTAALGAGFGIRLYDVDPHTLQPDLDSLRAALTAGATHVVCTHLFGRLVDLEAVAPLAAAAGAVLIEDAAQHAGGSLRRVRGGALAAVSILSFGRGKGINAGGGGALSWSAPAALALEPVQGPAPSEGKILATALLVDRLASPWVYRIPAHLPGLGLGATTYHAPQPLAPLSGVSAALLSLALDAEPALLARRQAAEAEYAAALADRPALLCRPHAELEGGALRFPVRLSPSRAAGLSDWGVARSYPRTLAGYPDDPAGDHRTHGLAGQRGAGGGAAHAADARAARVA